MRKAKFCPKCKSINVKIKIIPSAALGAPQKWQCLDCGFESHSIFPEKEIEKKTKKKKKGGKKKK